MFDARRDFLKLSAGSIAGLAAAVLPPVTLAQITAAPAAGGMRKGAALPKIKAVAFDSYGTLFDVDSVSTEAEILFPGKGKELAQLWRRKQIEYSWLRTMSKQYRDFWQLTTDGLVYATNKLQLELTPEKRTRLVNQYLQLKAFPENVAALKEFKKLGIPLIIVSNGTPSMLKDAVKSAGMEGIFNQLLSVDALKTFKTDPRVYQMGINALRLKAREICFVSSHCWDVDGAMFTGMQGYWVNRMNDPVEELGVVPTQMGPTLTDALQFVRQSRA